MGPLKGTKIVEVAGIGPVPFCGMLLADLGAEVVRIDRSSGGLLGGYPEPRFDIYGRGHKSVAVDLKHPDGAATVLRLVEQADALLEGFRPGVAEKLGIGPEPCFERNPKLVYGRMTGWGQEGPLAQAAGHDINYIALTGALAAIGRKGEPPVPPLNLVGDFGGGSLYLAVGVLAALLEARSSGKGQVVDAAMVDGAVSLMNIFHGLAGVGFWNEERESNMLDGGAHFYGTYETADGKYVSIGSIEPQFYALLLEKLGPESAELPDQHDTARWPEARRTLERIFKTKTRDEWCDIMEGTDVCFAPVLTMGEAAEHPHNRARANLVEIDGIRQPAPAPRFSRTVSEVGGPPPAAGADTDSVLAEWGFSDEEIARLSESGATSRADD